MNSTHFCLTATRRALPAVRLCKTAALTLALR